MCVLFAALFQLEPSSFAFRTFSFFPPKVRHNVGLLRFDDDHDHICYRLRRFKYLAEKVMSSNHYTLNKHLTSKLQISPNFTLDSVADSNYRGKCDVGGFFIEL
jgi:hypothetical protein